MFWLLISYKKSTSSILILYRLKFLILSRGHKSNLYYLLCKFFLRKSDVLTKSTTLNFDLHFFNFRFFLLMFISFSIVFIDACVGVFFVAEWMFLFFCFLFLIVPQTNMQTSP